MAIILDGKKVSDLRRQELKSVMETYFAVHKTRKPKLSVILVGNDSSSEIYVKNKARAAAKIGIESEIINLEATTTAEVLKQTIHQLNQDEKVDAILLQLPLPKHLIEEEFISLIDVKKDVDGFHFLNQGYLLQNLSTVYPCTPLGIINLLTAYQITFIGKRVSVVGTSNIVGKPLGLMLLNLGATVSFLNKNTVNLKEYTKKSDLIISATGVPNLITKKMIKKGAIIVDVGINHDPVTKKLVGDVNPDVAKKVSYLTPVPGGVGPMTITSLLENT